MTSPGDSAFARATKLFERWAEHQVLDGVGPDPEELCRESPELLPTLQDLIRDYRRLGRVLAPPADPGPEQGPAISLAPGTRLGPYEIQSRLGAGSMGEVYRARDRRLGRHVALKALPAEMAEHKNRVERLRREARSLASLNHPCIVTLYAIEEIDRRLFLAMELVEGETLAQRIPARGFDLEKFFALTIPLVDAVDAAHKQGVIHRDLKPSNIMMTPEGRIKVLDFGLAKLQTGTVPPDVTQLATEALTAAGAVIGTIAYMAPEQIRGGPADERADVFSLGVILYQMATGRHPFKTASRAELVSSILRDDPLSLSTSRPDLPRHLDRILRGALDKDRERRFQSARDLRNQLERLEQEVRERPTSEPAPTSRKVHRLAAAGAAAILVLAVGVGVSIWRPLSQPASLPARSQLAVTEVRRFWGDAGPEYYRRGFVAALGERLSGLQGVWVLPAGSTDPEPDLVVEADLRKRSDALTLHLEVQDQNHRALGSEILQGNAREPYDLLDRAGSAVADVLREVGLRVRYRAGPVATRDPTAFDLFLQAAEEAAGHGGSPDLDTALVLLTRASEADPRFAPARALTGEVHRRRYLETRDRESLDEAEAACRHAARLDDELGAAHLCLGRVHRALQDPVGAEKEYVRTIELRPTSADAYRELRQVFLEMSLPGAAEDTWLRVIDLHPGHWAGYRSLGGFYYDSQRWAAASEQYRRALELAPNNSLVERQLGSASHLLGRYDEAIAAYERSIDIRPTWDAHANLSELYRLMRDYPQAVESARKAVQFPEATHVAFGNLGRAYFWAPGRRDEATPAFERAVATCREHLAAEPEDADAWLWLAYDLAMLERREESLAALDEALQRRPPNPHDSYFVALIYNRLGDRQESLARLERAVRGGYGLAEIRASDEWQNLRDEPRFAALLEGG